MCEKYNQQKNESEGLYFNSDCANHLDMGKLIITLGPRISQHDQLKSDSQMTFYNKAQPSSHGHVGILPYIVKSFVNSIIKKKTFRVKRHPEQLNCNVLYVGCQNNESLHLKEKMDKLIFVLYINKATNQRTLLFFHLFNSMQAFLEYGACVVCYLD